MRTRLPSRAPDTPALIGRELEIRALTTLLEDVAGGHGGGLVIQGDAGMGKSALLSSARRCADDLAFRVLQTTGVHAESKLPFSGLHQLVRPIRGLFGKIPAGQREIIELALGMGTGPAPDLYAVALASLELFAEAAQEAPLVILADDVHWLDRPTVDVLAFVARRLASEPAAILFASRYGSSHELATASLPTVSLKPLDERASSSLIAQQAARLSPTLRDRLLVEANGNPLALVELPATWELLGDKYFDHPSHAVPLNSRLEQAFTSRMAEMPPKTRALLLAAATDPSCTQSELLTAATATLGRSVTLEDAEPAVRAGILATAEGALVFRHPLVRSALYSSSKVADRVAIHSALADVLSEDPDRSVWHRSSSTLGLDETVAADLEAFAHRSQNRGATAVAVAALESAARFSRGRRRAALLLEAGALACDLGRYAIGRGIVGMVASEHLDDRDRARLVAVREQSGTDTLAYDQPLSALVDAALAARKANDVHLATSLLWMAASRCWWTSADRVQRDYVARAAESLGLDDLDVRLVTIQGYADPLTRGRAGLERLVKIMPKRADLDELRFTASAAFILCDYPRSSRTFAAAITAANAQGRLGLMTRLLVVGGWSTAWTGNLDDVLAEANRAEELGRETGDNVWAVGAKALAAMVWGFRGDYQRCVDDVVQAQSEPALLRAPFLYSVSQQIRAIGALAVGRYEEAWTQLRRVSLTSDPAFHHDVQYWVCSDLADAAIGAGRISEGREIIAALEPDIEQAGWPWCLIGLRYARAVLATDEEAESRFRDALRHDLTEWPIDHGRLELAYGSWLASHGEREAARQHLQIAQAQFVSAGASAWATKARDSYQRAGGAIAKLAQPHPTVLSAHELNIARLAASGLTNRQIAQRLFVSHRTIASHLYRVFPKLGISTRAQLSDALRELGAR